MKKIPTLFTRDPDDMSKVTRHVSVGCEWVLEGEGVATRKYDGTCVMFDGHRWWARREVKADKAPPPNFAAIETDHRTGKTVGWEHIEQSAFARYHAEAIDTHAARLGFKSGTYELIGVKINGNPERIDPESGHHHHLICHEFADRLVAPRDYDRLAKFLASFDGEGIVWHHPDGRMAKLKRRDFRRPQ